MSDLDTVSNNSGCSMMSASRDRAMIDLLQIPQGDKSVMEFLSEVEAQASLCRVEEAPITEDDLKRMALIAGFKDRSLAEKCLAEEYDLEQVIATAVNKESLKDSEEGLEVQELASVKKVRQPEEIQNGPEANKDSRGKENRGKRKLHQLEGNEEVENPTKINKNIGNKIKPVIKLPQLKLHKKTQREPSPECQRHVMWEGFTIFSQFKATDKYGFNCDPKMRSWNPYTASIKQVSMFVQVLKSQKNFSDEDVQLYLNSIFHYIPEFRGKELPKVYLEENVSPLLKLINKEKPIGYYKSTNNLLNRYNDNIWTNFVIFYGNHVKEDPFLAEPHHVKDFIMEIFEEPNLPSLMLENYPDFYCGNVVNICKNLGFYLKSEYEEKSLLESKPIKAILDIFHSLDQKLTEPAGTGQCSTQDFDFQNMVPKYWYVKSNEKSHSKDFWRQKLVHKILMDVKNHVLSEGEAAWELGVTIDMISCQVQTMKPDQEFMSLTVNQYVEQGFGSEDKFWNEASTKMLLDDLRNRVTDVDTVAFQLGTSSAVVIKKAGRIKTCLEIEKEKYKLRLEKRVDAPPKLTPLELQVEMAEKNKDSLSDYEKMRLVNMKERLSLFNSLNIDEDKKTLRAAQTVKTHFKCRENIEPRKKSSRVKTLLEKNENLKVEESPYKEHQRRAPLWVGTRTPKITVDPIDIDEKLSWEVVDKSQDKLSNDELSAKIPVPKLTMAATELIASELDYHKGTRFLHRLESEVEICGREEKLRKDINIGKWIHVGGGKGSNDKIMSMAMSEELLAFGDNGGGLGFWLGEKRLLLRPHNMPVCRTIFMGSGSSTSVVTASHDGTIRVFDASKQEFSLAYSWNKRYKYKQGVVWLEPVDENLWLVNCEEGDLLNLDRRDRKVNKILSLPKSRRSCQSKLLSEHYSGEAFFATPALVGNNIAIHPLDQNLISLCDDESVLVYDRRNFQKPISTISSTATFDSSLWNSSLSHHCGSSWSQSGKHFVTCERSGIGYPSNRHLRQILQGSINLYLNARLADNDVVAKKCKSKLKNAANHNQIFTTGPGIVWSPWQEDVFYYMANNVYKQTNIVHGLVVGVNVNSGDVVGELVLPKQASNMMGFHPTRPQIVVANLNEAGEIVIYREEQG